MKSNLANKGWGWGLFQSHNTFFCHKQLDRHCATSRRVPGSIPGHWEFFPGHQTVPCVLGSTQPLKMSTRIFLGVKTAGA